MTIIAIYLTTLIVAPQLWPPPFVGIPAEYFVYPLWIFILTIQGRLPEFFRFRAIDWILQAMLVWIVPETIKNPLNARSDSTNIDYIKWIVLYRLVIVTVSTLPKLRGIKWPLLFFVMVLVVECIQHKLSPDGLGWAGQRLDWANPCVLAAGGTGRTRWMNIFDGPGVDCDIYNICLPIVLILLGPPYSFALRLFGCMLLARLLIATYFTGSRRGHWPHSSSSGHIFLPSLRIMLVRICRNVGSRCEDFRDASFPMRRATTVTLKVAPQ